MSTTTSRRVTIRYGVQYRQPGGTTVTDVAGHDGVNFGDVGDAVSHALHLRRHGSADAHVVQDIGGTNVWMPVYQDHSNTPHGEPVNAIAELLEQTTQSLATADAHLIADLAIRLAEGAGSA